jgi:hypothetical protein
VDDLFCIAETRGGIPFYRHVAETPEGAGRDDAGLPGRRFRRQAGQATFKTPFVR